MNASNGSSASPRACCSTPPSSTSSFALLSRSSTASRYRQLGFASLFDFLHREIGLSRGSAYYRQVGARLVRRFPEVEGPIRDGRLCITTVSELAEGDDRGEPGRGLAQVLRMLAPGGEAAGGGASAGGAGALTRTVVTAVPSSAGCRSRRRPTGWTRSDPAPRGRSSMQEVPGHRRGTPVAGGEQDSHHGVAGVRGAAEEGQGRPVPRPAGRDRRAGAHRGAGTAHRPAGEAAGGGSAEGEAGGREAGRGQVHVAAGEWRQPAAPPRACRSDHVVPRGKGGESTVENCRVLMPGP